MPNSTRDTFYNAIAQASTPVVAAGLVRALHVANMRELFEQLDELLNNEKLGGKEQDQQYNALKAEYTTV